MTISRLLTAAPLALALAIAACGNSGAAEGTDQRAAAASPAAATATPIKDAKSGWASQVMLTPEGGYAIGNPDAPVTLVEYGAVTCSHCAEFEQTAFAPLKAQYIDTGKVRFELRNFLLNPFDVPITLLTRCAGPDRFFPLTEAVFSQQEALMRPVMELSEKNPQALEKAVSTPPEQRFYELAKVTGMLDFFKARGISDEQARSCLGDVQAVEKLVNITQAGVGKGVAGTPTFFLNGEKIEDNTWDKLEPRLAAATKG